MPKISTALEKLEEMAKESPHLYEILSYNEDFKHGFKVGYERAEQEFLRNLFVAMMEDAKTHIDPKLALDSYSEKVTYSLGWINGLKYLKGMNEEEEKDRG